MVEQGSHTEGQDYNPRQSGETTPGGGREQHDVREGRRDREGEYQPPTLRYRWQSLEQFPEETQVQIRRNTELQNSGFSPREVVYFQGEYEGQVILNLVFSQAIATTMARMRGRTDDPITAMTAILAQPVTFVENGELRPARVFSRNNRASDELYDTAKGILLEEVNATLGSLRINKIPPPPDAPARP